MCIYPNQWWTELAGSTGPWGYCHPIVHIELHYTLPPNRILNHSGPLVERNQHVFILRPPCHNFAARLQQDGPLPPPRAKDVSREVLPPLHQSLYSTLKATAANWHSSSPQCLPSLSKSRTSDPRSVLWAFGVLSRATGL